MLCILDFNKQKFFIVFLSLFWAALPQQTEVYKPQVVDIIKKITV